MNRLRPEARPATWSELRTQQQDALRACISMLTQAVDQLSDTSGKSLRREDPAEWFQRDRSSRNIFVWGARGTGKTTVLASLVRLTSLNEVDDDLRGVELSTEIGRLQRRLVWLEPLDMETVPESANLLAAILARIDDAIHRIAGAGLRTKSANLGLLHARSHDPLMQLQRFESRVALGWEGNVRERAPRLDPDAFATEVMSSERNRLWVTRELRQVTDALAADVFESTPYRNPLFVLPIDDFDLIPASCLKLLRLLRSISVPRLATIVLGDVEIAEVVLNLKSSADLAALADKALRNEQVPSLPLNIVGDTAGHIAANAVRKLIPPSQRVRLEGLSLVESLNFRTLPNKVGGYLPDDLPLHELLNTIALPIDPPLRINGEKIRTLREWLLARGLATNLTSFPEIELNQEDLRDCAYHALQLFNSSPRRMTDLWLRASALRDKAKLKNGESGQPHASPLDWSDVLAFFADDCRLALQEEIGLSPIERRRTDQALRPHGRAGWNLSSIPFSVVPELGPLHTVKPTPSKSGTALLSKHQVHLLLHDALGWRLEVGGELEGTQADPIGIRPVRTIHAVSREQPAALTLSASSAAGLMITNDLAVLGPEAQRSSGLLSRGGGYLGGWATTQWSSGLALSCELPWPAPEFESFWQYDLFLRSWRDALGDIRADKSTLVGHVDTLLFAWIAAGTAVLDGDSYPGMNGALDWAALVDRLETLRQQSQAASLAGHQMRRWLKSLVFFAMPESGVFVDAFREQAARTLGSAWGEEWREVRRRRALRLAHIASCDMPALAEQLRTMTLPTAFRNFRPEKKVVAELAEQMRSSVDPDADEGEELAPETVRSDPDPAARQATRVTSSPPLRPESTQEVPKHPTRMSRAKKMAPRKMAARKRR